jgi:hypothetical protein
MNILPLDISNKILIKIIERNKPFSIVRVGIGAETYLSYMVLSNMNINNKEKFLFMLSNNAGIYDTEKNIDNVYVYCNKYISSIKNSDCFAAFPSSIINEQNLLRNPQKPVVMSRVLEPFYLCDLNIKPWTHYLKNKVVLVISPFTESFKKQLQNKFQIFKDPTKKIFLDDQQFIFYKCYQTAAGNHIHKNWNETLNKMCEDISKLKFDIALVSCGGYGLLINDFIKNNMEKSAIYIGGGLQLLFGVMGGRWENNDFWLRIIKENDSKFIRPSEDEIIKNKDKIECGCYW